MAGSQLVFVNTYSSSVTDAYRTAIVFAEHELQSHFTNNVTITASFGFANLSGFLAQNSFHNTVHPSYATLRAALQSHATTADDIAAVNSLPAADPSGGTGFLVAGGMARLLGLPGAGTSSSADLDLVLGNGFTWNFDPNNRGAANGYDAIGAIEHELSEGGFGRVGGLGYQNHTWAPMDLFRYSSAGQRDYTGGKDGLATYFSVDGNQLLTPFHNSVNTSGVFDGQDPADWNIGGDSFGFGGKGVIGVLSSVDLRVLDILGWTPIGSTPLPPTDDFRNSLTDTTHPFGSVVVNGSSTGNLEVTGDRDWFQVQLTTGTSYVITVLGQQGGGGTLEDSYLRVHNSAGTLLTENDDIVLGTNRDSQLTFTPTATGTFYLDVGAFNDGYAGTYRVSVATTASADDFKDSLTDTGVFGSVVVNDSSTGILEVNGDRDWFQIQLTAGASYVINLQGQQAGGGTLVDPYLRVHNSAGTLLAENDDIVLGINRDSQLTFTATTGGTYYLEAGAFDDSYKGTYRLSVSQTILVDDYANSLTDPAHPFGQVAVNGSSTGNLETAGDRDWFHVQLAAGTTYFVNLQGQQAGAGTLEDPYLRVHNSAGTLVAENDDIVLGINRDSQLTFTPTSAGNYYLEAGSYVDSYTGTYKVSVTQSGPSVWHVVGAGDVNGDSHGDILWQNDNGEAGIWLLSGANVTYMSGPNDFANPGPSWHIEGAGDFNGDHKSDILWQNDNGQAGVWLLNGATPTVQTNIGGNPGPSWHVEGAGDFNGDGKSDFLWQNDNGQAGIWLLNGTSVITQTNVGGNPGSAWHAIGTGDFNGDGKADILWQNDNGQAGVWLMNGTNPILQTDSGNPGTVWHVKAAGDFNGDGKADILWQNDNGQAAVWLMNGAIPIARAEVGANPGSAWHVLAAADFNGDGKADILWQNDNGQAGVWLMNGTTPILQADVGFNPDALLH